MSTCLQNPDSRFARRLVRRVTLMLVAVAGSAGCDFPGDSVVREPPVEEGTYPGSWTFMFVDRGIYVDPPEVPPGTAAVHGMLYCPGEFRVSRQDGDHSSGTFHVTVPAEPACTDGHAGGFCTLPGVQSFCRDVSGRWSGTISRGLGPDAAVADFRFRLDDGDGPTVEALTGCRIIARPAAGAGDRAFAEFFGTTVYVSIVATTIDCPAATGFGTVDMGAGMHGERTPPTGSEASALEHPEPLVR
jgi:hypothetical protein